MMTTAFRDIPIEQLCTKVTTGATPLRSRKEYYEEGTINWYKTGELKDWYLGQAEERITEQALTETSVKLFPANTVLMAMYGDGRTITSMGMLRVPATTNQACSAMLVNEKICDTRYFFYALKGRRHILLKVASGGAQRNLSGKLIKEFAIPVPPLRVQHRIADILSAYDELIENNLRRIKILEEMARSLYREWFVLFRFPGHDKIPLVDSPLGKIPKGWEVKPLDEIATITMGLSPKGNTYNNLGDGTPLVNGPVEFGERFTKQVKWTTEPSKICKEGDLVVCVRGSTTGKYVKSDGVYCLGRGVCGIGSKFQSFIALLFENELPTLLGQTSGSTFPSWTGPQLKSHPVLLPPTDLLERFETLVRPMSTAVLGYSRKIQNLRCTRDLLLPRLLAGEVSIFNNLGGADT